MSVDDEPGPSIVPHVLDVDIAFPSGYYDINIGSEEEDDMVLLLATQLVRKRGIAGKEKKRKRWETGCE